MQTNVLIRESKKEDSAAVYSLLLDIAKLHKSGRPDIFVDLVSKYSIEEVESRLSAIDNGVFVAVYQNTVVGYVFCEIKTEGNGKTLYIDDLCVASNVRRMGIGKKLIDRAREYAIEKDCVRLMLNVWEFNESAVDFYENYGFTTRSRHMEMNV